MKIEKYNIMDIKPYWRNPRINKRTIELVKTSIEDYGYIQPITIDSRNIIITGHSRYKALLELGYNEIEAIKIDMPKEKAKEYRIIDNKVTEYTFWDKDILIDEIKDLDVDFLGTYFKPGEIDNWLKKVEDAQPAKTIEIVNEVEVDDWLNKIEDKQPETEVPNKKSAYFHVSCIHCGEEVRIDIEKIINSL